MECAWAVSRFRGGGLTSTDGSAPILTSRGCHRKTGIVTTTLVKSGVFEEATIRPQKHYSGEPVV